MNGHDATRLADDLELLRTGRLSERDFRAKYQMDIGGVLSVIWPNLEHYLADEDIRGRDPAYRVMQEAEMEKLVTLLRAGASDNDLANVTFLRRS